ncbi:MAG: class I SAM-dependent methyltransferase [Smithellaceae bacterium]
MQKKSKSDFVNFQDYLMESDDEAIRLEVKTDPVALRRQAIWCGLKPGMRVLDAGCGPGKTTSLLYDIVRPGGSVVGIDCSEARIRYAKEHYRKEKGIEFHLQNFNESIMVKGEFDLIWVRFVLEYYRHGSLDIVKKLKNCLKPGGILCLIDLDYNCLSHYELPPKIAEILPKIMSFMDEEYNFDTFAGRKLYSYLYDSGFEKIDIEVMGNNLIFGEIENQIQFDWIKKVEIAAKKAGRIINAYPGGYKHFYDDFREFMANPRRFTYAPLLLCKGIRPLSG